MLMQKNIEKVIGWLYTLVAVGIVLILILSNNVIENRTMKGNAVLMIWAVLFLGIIFLLNKCICKYGKKSINVDGVIRKITIAMFFLMTYICCNIYFKTGWDIWTIDYGARTLLGEYEYIDWLNYYYGIYPNNILLTWVYCGTLAINKFFGVFDTENAWVVFIILNCIIAWVTVYLTYYCIKKRNGIKAAVLGWGLCALLVGFSPWATIPYSDPLTVFIPVLIYSLYLQIDENKWWLYGIIFFIGVLGYHLKPQAVIILIAIILVELLKVKKIFSVYVLKKIICCVLGIVIAEVIYIGLSNGFVSKIPIDEQREFTPTHWFMMGLNEETGGKYNGKDVDFSQSFSTITEREAANMDVAIERLKAYGVSGYISFLINKTAVCYGDASFSWSTGAGDFYSEIYELKNQGTSKFFRSIFYYNGDLFPVYSTTLQTIWLFILLMSLFVVCRKGNDKGASVLMLTFLGVAAFELLFEVFPRHLYCNAPIFIVLAMSGCKNVLQGISTICERGIKIRK